MKINGVYTVKKIGNDYYALPISGTVNQNAMIRLNECGAFIFERLIKGKDVDEIVKDLTCEYNVGESEAGKDLDDFISAMKEAKVID